MKSLVVILAGAAVVLFLAARGGDTGYDRDPDELITLAVRRQWGKDPPEQVADWVAADLFSLTTNGCTT